MLSIITKYKNYISLHGSSAVVVTAGMVITKLLALVTAILVARYTGASTFGEFTLFTSIFIIASTVPEQLDNTYIVKASTDDGRVLEPGYRLANLIIKVLFLLGSVFLLSFLYFIITNYYQEYKTNYILVSVAIVSGLSVSFYNSVISYYRFKKDFSSVALRKPVLNALILAGFIFIIYISTGNIRLTEILQVYLIVAVSIIFIVSFSVVPVLNLNMEKAIGLVKPFMKHSTILLISCVISLIANRIDVFFLAKQIPFDELGNYGIALRIAAVASMFTAVVATILLPSAPEALTGKKAYKTYLKKAVFYLVGQGIIAFTLFFAAGVLVDILFPDQPLISKELSRILIVQSFIVAIGTPFLSLIQSKQAPLFLITIAVVKMAMGIVLMLILVPEYGVKGGAYGVVITSMIVSFSMVYLCLKQYKNMQEEIVN
jgi:O-antigen/teichoic acid export membrane protein